MFHVKHWNRLRVASDAPRKIEIFAQRAGEAASEARIYPRVGLLGRPR